MRSSASRRRMSSRNCSARPSAMTWSTTLSTSASPSSFSASACSRMNVAQLVVRDLEPELVGGGLERELARERRSGLGGDALLHLLGRLIGDGQVGLDGDAPALERLHEAGQQPVRPCGDQALRRLDVRRLDERVDGRGTELGLDSASSCSRRRDSMSARSSASVSNSLAVFASSSSSGGSTFSLISFSVAVTDCVAPSSPTSNAISFSSPADMSSSPRSSSSTRRPPPSSTTTSRRDSPDSLIRSTIATSPSWAGRPSTGRARRRRRG